MIMINLFLAIILQYIDEHSRVEDRKVKVTYI